MSSCGQRHAHLADGGVFRARCRRPRSLGFEKPTAGFAERVYVHELSVDEDGFLHFASVNRVVGDNGALGHTCGTRRVSCLPSTSGK